LQGYRNRDYSANRALSLNRLSGYNKLKSVSFLVTLLPF
jgi:hypothetical protein